jgi:uncharacterized protein
VDELKKPNRDPRDGYPKPIMQKGVVSFEDLHEGMMITGKIKNVVDFGAFVDLGIKETALVHISELSDRFIKDPMDAVKVGDVLEFRIIGLDQDRRRISLSRKTSTGSQTPAGSQTNGSQSPKAPGGNQTPGGSQSSGSQAPGGSQGAGRTETGRHGEKRVVAVKKAGGPPSPKIAAAATAGQRDDDGTMYNPFADAFKKMREKK